MNWKKVTLITLDVILAVYVILAMTSFNKPDEQNNLCTDVKVNIQKDVVDGFLTVNKVKMMLNQARLYPVGQPMNSINTRQIEEMLQSNDLIENAECYKTQTGHLCLNIKQRIPVIRIMAENGDDYYVDNHGLPMPHTDYSCDLVVATGKISKKYASKWLTPLANYVLTNDFWKNQIVQLNVLQDGSVEIIPRVGSHIAYLGQPTDIQSKLERLRKFYVYGLSQTGWNKYSRISVEFDNQIICKKNRPARHHR
jgi:cell division protein FtsQ